MQYYCGEIKKSRRTIILLTIIIWRILFFIPLFPHWMKSSTYADVTTTNKDGTLIFTCPSFLLTCWRTTLIVNSNMTRFCEASNSYPTQWYSSFNWQSILFLKVVSLSLILGIQHIYLVCSYFGGSSPYLALKIFSVAYLVT